MITFCKSAKCPPSIDLLAFQNNELTVEEELAVEAHVNYCEFCEAEIEFYTHYPQSNDRITKAEIPIPLFDLAHSLMRKSNHDLLEFLFSGDKVPT